MKFSEYKEKVLKENPEVKEEYETIKFRPETMTIKPLHDYSGSLNFVSVDDMFCEMMNYAVRYACGRRTYAASSTANYVCGLVDKLDTQTLSVMLRDIDEQEKISLGDDIDERGWIRLKGKIKKMLEKRGVNNADH